VEESRCPPTEEAKQCVEIDTETKIKALTLLKGIIGEELFIRLIASDFLEIRGKYGTYEIYRNGAIHLKRQDIIGNKIRPLEYRLCIEIGNKEKSLCEGDRILSLYFSIINDEEKFIETANFRNVSTIDEYTGRNDIVGGVTERIEPERPTEPRETRIPEFTTERR